MSYFIRENFDPIPEGHYNFIEKSIACTPLAGPIFEADARRVNQVINSNVQCKAAEQWIEPNKTKQNGLIDMLTLRDHYSGEVNSCPCIGEAERLCDTIHYKIERSMWLSSYLGKVQKMLNIFNDQKEPYTHEMTVQFFLGTYNTLRWQLPLKP